MLQESVFATVLEVTCEELNARKERTDSYIITAYEFSNGLILVPQSDCADTFFEGRDSIEANEYDVVDTVQTAFNADSSMARVELTGRHLLEAVQASIKSYGVDSVPAKHVNLWKKSRYSPVAVFTVYSLDVWGNAEEGWEINQMFEHCTLAAKEIRIRLLISQNLINPEAKDDISIVDYANGCISVESSDTCEPLYEIRYSI